MNKVPNSYTDEERGANTYTTKNNRNLLTKGGGGEPTSGKKFKRKQKMSNFGEGQGT